MYRWIEVEPDAPLPPEVPPSAEPCVEAPQPLPGAADGETVRGFGSTSGCLWTLTAASMVVCAVSGYMGGMLPLGAATGILLSCLLPPAVSAIQRRLKSEAEVSERFLQASDPRNPIPSAAFGTAGQEASLPAANARGHDEAAGA